MCAPSLCAHVSACISVSVCVFTCVCERAQVPYMYAGTKMYDFIARLGGGDTGTPPSSFLNKEEALYRFPMLKGTDRSAAHRRG